MAMRAGTVRKRSRHLEDRRELGDHDGLVQHGHRIERLSVERLVEQVLLGDHAERLVDSAATDQHLLVAAFVQLAPHLLGVVAGIEPVDVQARGHDVADAAAAEIEDAIDQFVLRPAQQPGFLAGGHQQFDFLGRVQRLLAGAGLEPDRAQHEVAQAVEHHDGGFQHEREQHQRAHAPQRRAFGALQRQALGCELAEHDVERGDGGERDRDGDRVRAGRRERTRPSRQQRLDQVRQRRLAQPAQRQRRQRDPELGRGQVGVEVLERAFQRGGVRAAGGDELRHAALSHRHQRELRRDEEAVRRYQREDPEHACEVGHGGVSRWVKVAMVPRRMRRFENGT
jgi:hypothetical protein